MKKKKFLIIFLIIALLPLMSFITGRVVYATMSMDEIIKKLEFANSMGMLGNLSELKQVINKTYVDLNSASTIDDTVKAKLKEDISELSNVSGLSSTIVDYLKSEFDSRIDELTDDNVSQLKTMIETVNGWVNTKVEESSNSEENVNNETDETETPDTEEQNTENDEVVGEEDTQQTDPQIVTVELDENNKNNAQNTGNSEQTAEKKIPNTGLEQLKLFAGIAIMGVSIVVSVVGYEKLKEI